MFDVLEVSTLLLHSQLVQQKAKQMNSNYCIDDRAFDAGSIVSCTLTGNTWRSKEWASERMDKPPNQPTKLLLCRHR